MFSGNHGESNGQENGKSQGNWAYITVYRDNYRNRGYRRFMRKVLGCLGQSSAFVKTMWL